MDIGLSIAIYAGVCAGLAAYIGGWIGRRLGHLEAIGVVRYPQSTDPPMLRAKEAANFTMRLCGLKEIE